jgi:hypothetical protein
MLVVAFVSKELKMAKAQAIFSPTLESSMMIVATGFCAGFAASGDYLAASLLAVPTVALIMTSVYKNSR